MPLKCVLFDLDNTLLDLPIDWDSLRNEITAKFLGKKTRKKAARLNKYAFYKFVYGSFYEKAGSKTRKALLSIRQKFELKGARESILLFPKTKKLLRELSRHYLLGIVSGNSSKAIKLALKKHSFQKFFPVIVGLGETRIKPSPEPLLLAAKKLRLKPRECVYVCDNPDDVLSAKRAGMKAIKLKRSFHSFIKAKALPFRELNDLSELPSVLKQAVWH